MQFGGKSKKKLAFGIKEMSEKRKRKRKGKEEKGEKKNKDMGFSGHKSNKYSLIYFKIYPSF